MASPNFNSSLFLWMKDFNSVERMNFTVYSMNSLFWFRKIPLQPQILNAATNHWDPDLHVFRFGLQELCPTVEEFHALLNCKSQEQVVIPRKQQISPAGLLEQLLGLSRRKAKELLIGGQVNVLSLIKQFQPLGDPCDEVYQGKRRFALCICVLARFLLVSGNETVSTDLVDVAAQIKEKMDFVPMVLAETLLGLDKIHSKASTSFTGSPLLLQMWLFDKVNLLERPTFISEDPYYYAKDYTKDYNNRIIKHHNTTEGWSKWFSTLKSNDINWRCFRFVDSSWSKIIVPDMTIKNMNFKRVAIVGLTSFTFYAPCRFLRQLGNDQGMPPVELEAVFNPSMRGSLIHYKKSWPSRQKLAAKKGGFNSGLEKTYVKWLQDEIKEKAQKEGTEEGTKKKGTEEEGTTKEGTEEEGIGTLKRKRT